MGVKSYRGHVEEAHEQKRRLWQDRLNLTSAQKRALISKIAVNAEPANRNFSYQYWYKNCATIPRDYLDEVLEGAIRGKFYGLMLPVRYRDYVRANLATTPFVVPTLDIVMNGNIDKPISVWQDMFLPVKLREHLLTMPAIDDEGEPVRGRTLLSDSRVLLPYKENYKRPFNDYLALTAPVVGPLAFGLLALLLAQGRAEGAAAAWRPRGYKALGAGLVFYGLLAGVYGVVMTVGWMFSGHPDTWASANLLLLWPGDFLYCAVGAALWRRGAPVRDAFPVPNIARFYAACHLAALAVMIGFGLGGVIFQDMWPVVTWLGTAAVVANAALLKVGLLSRLRAAPPVGQDSQDRAKRSGRAKRRLKAADV
jgi:hypothetical protein